MNRTIRKAAVLGSGLMGMGIAAHLANIGVEVLLLDIVPFDLEGEARKLKSNRNKLADNALKNAAKANRLKPFYDASFASRIQTGNFEDDFPRIKECDWIIEVVVERLDIKKKIFDQVDTHRKAGSLVTSNTSGIPIHMMLEGRSEDFAAHFCGTHFFNPPRYLKLLEIIPTPKTSQEVVDFFMYYGDVFLGKKTVLCKDTPAFIANRVGVYALAKLFQLVEEYDLTIEEVDALTGPISGRPKTGTFRLGDLVGHDTTAHVMQGIIDNCPEDEQLEAFKLSKAFKHLLDNKWFGDKSGQGFYKAERQKDGSKKISSLDLNTLEYREKEKPRLDCIGAARNREKLEDRIRILFDHDDKGGKFVRASMLGMFAYVSNRIPEIANHLYSIDDAVRAGFAWEAGPFQYWDMIGVERGVKLAEEAGYTVAKWVKDMIASGKSSFYSHEGKTPKYFDLSTKAYQEVPGLGDLVILDNYRSLEPVFKNAGVTLHDIGDQVLNLEFHTKMNAIGADIIEGMNKAIEIAENGDWRGLVIGNNATNFSVGANLAMMGMLAFQQQWDQLDLAVKEFQNANMRLRYSSIPVVAATQGFVFGGGCEVLMHSDRSVVAAESYVGLVEFGVGLIPGAGGSKEFAVRAGDSFFEGDVQIPTLIEHFTAIATAKVSTSAWEAYGLNYLKANRDYVEVNTSRAIARAKAEVIELSDKGYTAPPSRHDIKVLGQHGLGALYAAAGSMHIARYASEHDMKIARKLAFVLCGGDLSAPQQVSEQYLLDLEREAFLSLVAEPKTLERIQHMLQFNKPLRN